MMCSAAARVRPFYAVKAVDTSTIPAGQSGNNLDTKMDPSVLLPLRLLRDGQPQI
jgi:hypothetical protein